MTMYFPTSYSRLNGAGPIQFTANPVPFSFCGNLIGENCKFTHAFIMRLRSESGNRTSVSLATWVELATTLLDMPPMKAQHIFDVFYAISGGCIQGMPSFARHASNQRETVYYRHDNNRSLLNSMDNQVNEASWAKASESRYVSLPGLIMFLSIQLFLALSPKSNRTDDIEQAIYLETNISDYISAISITVQDKVTPHDVSDLEFVMRQFCEGKETHVGAGEELFPWPPEGKPVISIALLSQFIRPRIVPTKLLATKGIKDTRKLTVNGLNDTIYLLPQLPAAEFAVSFMSATCEIASCTRSSVYMPCPLPCTRLANLENCTIVLGPVVGVLLITNCVGCSISALCGAVVIEDCEKVNVHVCTNTPPVLLNNSQEVLVGPYNTFYAMMSKDCQDTGISPLLNLWNIGLPTANTLPPRKYSPVTFLVSLGVSKEWSKRGGVPTTSNISVVPSIYQYAVNCRLEYFQCISKDIQGTYNFLIEEGHTHEANVFRSKIHSMFIAWINESGQGKGLLDLLHQPNA